MAMGSPLSLVLANLFVEEFEEKAITEAPHTLTFWGRYINDTGVVIKKEHEDELFQHIIQQHTNIKFTSKQEDDENSRITTDIYKKWTHTDQYLQWTSKHPVHLKLGIVRRLMHHAETLIKDEGRMKIEKVKVI